MTQGEFDAAQKSGAISVEDTTEEGPETSTPAETSISIEQFIPILLQLQGVQLCVSVAPTYIPQTFQEQIVFVFDGADYFLYLYFNNQWNAFAVSGGGGGGGVTQLISGFGISISPGGGTGIVTISCTIDDATIPMSDITTNNVSTSQHGFAPKLPNDGTKFLNGLGGWTVPPGTGGGGGSDALGPIGGTGAVVQDATTVRSSTNTNPSLPTIVKTLTCNVAGFYTFSVSMQSTAGSGDAFAAILKNGTRMFPSTDDLVALTNSYTRLYFGTFYCDIGDYFDLGIYMSGFTSVEVNSFQATSETGILETISGYVVAIPVTQSSPALPPPSSSNFTITLN